MTGPLALTIPDDLVERIAQRLAAAVLQELGAGATRGSPERWLDTQRAADYLGLHRDTVRKLAAAAKLPYEQDRPGAKLYFRQSALDGWRASGGAPAHLRRVV